MAKKTVRDVTALYFKIVRGFGEINRIPVNDSTDDEIETGGPEGLAVERAVTNLTPLVEIDGAFELVGRFSLVETSLTAAAKCRIGPVERQ